MKLLVNPKQLLLPLGDIITFYLALFLTLVIRYQAAPSQELLNLHLAPFSTALVLWLITFYIGGLYHASALSNRPESTRRLLTLILTGGGIMIFLFYFIPAFGIAPKFNLFLFIGIFGLLTYGWRYLLNGILRRQAPKNHLLIVGINQCLEELVSHLEENPQLGFEISFWMKDGLQNKTAGDLSEIIATHHITHMIVPAHVKKNQRVTRLIYQNLMHGIGIVSAADLYEMIFQKVSLVELEEMGFLEHFGSVHRPYQTIRRIVEVLLSLFLFVALSPVFLLAAFLVAVSSSGPIIYKQTRVGQNQKPFSLYKFRSMYATKDKNPDADASAPTWTAAGDSRITKVGKMLRFTHLDELPQLVNILKNEMSFIGPRPERPEFVKDLEKQIPAYELRFLVPPGITGWAQINYRYGSSTEDAYEKLQYDMYYIKNRSIFLDLGILAKTIKRIFVQER